MHTWHGFSLANGLADVGGVGSLERAVDHREELPADFRCKDVALFGVRTRLPDGLRKRAPAVHNFLRAFGGAFLRQRLAQFHVLLHKLDEVTEGRGFRARGRALWRTGCY